MPTSRWEATAGAIESKLYVAGGWGLHMSEAVGASTLSTLESYDPSTSAWSALPSMPTARWGLAPCAAVIRAELYVLGGGDPLGPKSTLESYDPSMSAWSALPSMPTARQYLATAVVASQIYCLGGSLSHTDDDANRGSVVQTVEVYDPSASSWASLPDMPRGAEYLAAATISSRLYAVGGWADAGGYTGALDVYDISTSEWSSAAPAMPTGRSGAVAGTINNVLFVAGGHDGGGELAALESFVHLSLTPTMMPIAIFSDDPKKDSTTTTHLSLSVNDALLCVVCGLVLGFIIWKILNRKKSAVVVGEDGYSLMTINELHIPDSELLSLLETSPAPSFVVGCGMRITMWNPGA